MSLKPEYKALANHFKNVSNTFLLHRIAPHCISMHYLFLHASIRADNSSDILSPVYLLLAVF